MVVAEKYMIAPARKSAPIRKIIFTMLAPRFDSLRKVSFTLNDRYSTTAEKKIRSNMNANAIAITVRSIDMLRLYLLGFSHSVIEVTISSVKLITLMPSRNVL